MSNDLKMRLKDLSEELATEACAAAEVSAGTPGDPNSVWKLVDLMAAGEFDTDLADDVITTLEGVIGVIQMAQLDIENEDDGGEE